MTYQSFHSFSFTEEGDHVGNKLGKKGLCDVVYIGVTKQSTDDLSKNITAVF